MINREEMPPDERESRRGDPWSDDRVYRALASTQRRRMLSFLLEEGESTVEEIATMLTGWEATVRGTMRTGDDHRRIVIGLVHVHLPILAEAGLVTHDRQSGTVRIGSLDPSVEDLVRRSVESG